MTRPGVLLLVASWLATGCVVKAVAQAPRPIELSAPKGSGTFRLAVLRISDEELCSTHSRLREFCVTRLRSAMSQGLRTMLGRFIDGTRPGAVYTAAFRLLAFSHDYAPEEDDDDSADEEQDLGFEARSVSVRLRMRWSFELRDNRGHVIVQLVESTDGPMELVRLDDADESVRALLQAVVYKIAAALAAAKWPQTGPS